MKSPEEIIWLDAGLLRADLLAPHENSGADPIICLTSEGETLTGADLWRMESRLRHLLRHHRTLSASDAIAGDRAKQIKLAMRDAPITEEELAAFRHHLVDRQSQQPLLMAFDRIDRLVRHQRAVIMRLIADTDANEAYHQGVEDGLKQAAREAK